MVPPSGDDDVRLDPEAIAERQFPTARKGYDTQAVRAFLTAVGESHRALLARLDAAEADARAVLEGAEARRAEVLREAQDEAKRQLAAVAAERDRTLGDAAAAAEAQRDAILSTARAEADALVAEARAARQRVLEDLRRRRKAARTQVEQLHAARERLLSSLAVVRSDIDATTLGLRDALPDAKQAADAAARRVEAEPEASVAQLEAEIEALRLAGLTFGDGTSSSSAGDAAAGAVGAVGLGGAAADLDTGEVPAVAAPPVEPPPVERRSSAVRIVRPLRPQDPITGLPEGELHPLDAPDPVEEVRLVTAEDLAAAPPPAALAPDPTSVASAALADADPADEGPAGADDESSGAPASAPAGTDADEPDATGTEADAAGTDADADGAAVADDADTTGPGTGTGSAVGDDADAGTAVADAADAAGTGTGTGAARGDAAGTAVAAGAGAAGFAAAEGADASAPDAGRGAGRNGIAEGSGESADGSTDRTAAGTGAADVDPGNGRGAIADVAGEPALPPSAGTADDLGSADADADVDADTVAAGDDRAAGGTGEDLAATAAAGEELAATATAAEADRRDARRGVAEVATEPAADTADDLGPGDRSDTTGGEMAEADTSDEMSVAAAGDVTDAATSEEAVTSMADARRRKGRGVVADLGSEPAEARPDGSDAGDGVPDRVGLTATEVVADDADEPTGAVTQADAIDDPELADSDNDEARESAADEAVAAAEGGGAPSRPPADTVDALFARLRSGRAERVAGAEAALGTADRSNGNGVAAAAPEPPGPDDAASAPPPPAAEPAAAATTPVGDAVAALVTVEDVAVHRGGGAEREELLARRDSMVDPIATALSRRLKRLLADEQNEVLDALRRSGVADALPDPVEHLGRWAHSVGPELAEAAAAGARFAVGDDVVTPSPGDLAEIADAVAAEVARPLRERLTRVLDASEGDAEHAAGAVRAAYRTWRSERIGPAAEHAVLDAFSLGLTMAAGDGTELCWVVDDGAAASPDCEDDALAGPVPNGEPFPTGHHRPPAHHGCRCVLVPPTDS